MKKLPLWQSLPVLFLFFPLASCFYTYNSYYGPDGGTSSTGASGSAASSGSAGSGASGSGGSTSTSAASTGGSGGSTSGGSSGGRASSSGGSSGGASSSGSSGTSGANSSGGSFVPTFSCGPDAGWPTSCHLVTVSASTAAANAVPLPIYAVSVAALGGGDYLVGANGDPGNCGPCSGPIIAFVVSADGGVTVAPTTASYGFGVLAFAQSGSGTALFGSDQLSNANGCSQLDCADPFSGSPKLLGVPDGSCPSIDQIQAATAVDGTLAVAWWDSQDPLALFGQGSASGVCPT